MKKNGNKRKMLVSNSKWNLRCKTYTSAVKEEPEIGTTTDDERWKKRSDGRGETNVTLLETKTAERRNKKEEKKLNYKKTKMEENNAKYVHLADKKGGVRLPVTNESGNQFGDTAGH